MKSIRIHIIKARDVYIKGPDNVQVVTFHPILLKSFASQKIEMAPSSDFDMNNIINTYG
jgi:hypothetical protein